MSSVKRDPIKCRKVDAESHRKLLSGEVETTMLHVACRYERGKEYNLDTIKKHPAFAYRLWDTRDGPVARFKDTGHEVSRKKSRAKYDKLARDNARAQALWDRLFKEELG